MDRASGTASDPVGRPNTSIVETMFRRNTPSPTAASRPNCPYGGVIPSLRRVLMFATALLLVFTTIPETNRAFAQSERQPPQAGAAAPGGAQAPAVPLFRQARNVAVITLRTGDRPIDSVTAKSFIRRLRMAENQGADAFVVELDTPGGEIGAVLDICAAIKASTIPNSVAWINTKAFSGGAVIALACREIVVHPQATWGDALPIAASPLGLMNLPEQERAKFLVGLLVEVVDSARRKNRERYIYDEYIVQAMLTTGAPLWWIRNKETGVEMAVNREEFVALFGVEPPRTNPVVTLRPGDEGPPTLRPYPAPDSTTGARQSLDPDRAFQPASPVLENLRADVDDSLASMSVGASRRPRIDPGEADKWELVGFVTDGSVPLTLAADDMFFLNLSANNPANRPIRTDEELKDWFGAENLSRLDPLWSEGLVQFMTSMPVRGLLLVVFLLALFIEMVTPGGGFAGVVAAVALGLLLVPPMLMGMATWWEIVAILGGIVLILLEIFVFPGVGVAGITGVILLFFGLLFTFVPDSGLFPDTEQQQQDMLYGFLTMVLAIVTAGVGMWMISRHFKTLPLLRGLVLADGPGDQGEGMLEAMAPERPAGPMPGSIGVASSTLRPVGVVDIEGRAIDAAAESGYIPAGTRVRVVERREFDVVVELADEDDEPGPDGRTQDQPETRTDNA